MEHARLLGVFDQIHYLGIVPAETMAGLYAGAVALVMPTLHGPTNIPVLEAWACDCPVITSRIRGIMEHVASDGVLADPTSAIEIARGIQRVWLDDEFAADLVRRGRRRIQEYTFSDFRERLRSVVGEAIQFVEAGNP
jgi:glycosyltransferase involved in cell wall biosynthesis